MGPASGSVAQLKCETQPLWPSPGKSSPPGVTVATFCRRQPQRPTLIVKQPIARANTMARDNDNIGGVGHTDSFASQDSDPTKQDEKKKKKSKRPASEFGPVISI